MAPFHPRGQDGGTGLERRDSTFDVLTLPLSLAT
jgi:hypothetical protein